MMTDEQRDAVEQAVRAVIDELFEAARQVDSDRFLATCSTKDNLGFAFSGAFWPSLAEFERTFVRPVLANFERQDIVIKEARVAVLAPDAAAATVTADFKMYERGGATSATTSSVTLVFSKEDEGWKVIHLHESLPLPQQV